MKNNDGRSFTGGGLAEIALPLGGIGTGTVSLGGRGQLQDWELFNRPNKGSVLPMTFVALRAAPRGGPAVTRVLERQFLPPFTGASGFRGHALAGLPRFTEAVFRGAYPFAEIEFQDAAMPVQVTLEAFNPFIPMNVPDSSIPGAILRYRVRNPLHIPVSVSLLATMSNPVGAQPLDPDRPIMNTQNSYRTVAGLQGLYFTAPDLPWDDVDFGTAALTTTWPDVDCQTVLPGFRPGGWDAAHRLWDAFTATGRIEPVIGHRHDALLDGDRARVAGAPGALCLRAELAAGAEQEMVLLVHWHFPHTRLWRSSKEEPGVPVRTFVATQFTDAWHAAEHTVSHLERLDAQTRRWQETFFHSDLPPEVLDAVSSHLVTIRSPTVLRLADGAIYAYEGCGDQRGCCPGNCIHVWNYEQALGFLFPSLARTMRRINFGSSLKPGGAMAIGCDAPAGALNFGVWSHDTAADGQMGNIIQAYRDWQLSGDDTFLNDLWPGIQRALHYAWTAPNGWDPNRDGVMEGRQHHTYDGDFYGPNSMISSLYLGALRAAEAMADHLGEKDKARDYHAVYASGRARIERDLWNGEYFFQKTEVMPGLDVPPDYQLHPIPPGVPRCGCKPTCADADDGPRGSAEPKYQCGAGCLSDQLVGQWESHVAGLGPLLDAGQVRTALSAVFRHNFRAPIGALANVQRVYALQDEAGLVLCSWPRGGRPAVPFLYCDEVWSGTEYEVAAHMIYEGLVEEGLQIVRAARARHDGVRRNPWDEVECGHHYARTLSSWSLVQALSGARYSAVEQSLVFDPRRPLPFACVFAAGSAWGLARVGEQSLTLEVRYGHLTLARLGVRECVKRLDCLRRLNAGDTVTVALD